MVLGSTLTTDDTLNFLGVDCCRAVNNPRMAMEGSSVIKKQIYIYSDNQETFHSQAHQTLHRGLNLEVLDCA